MCIYVYIFSHYFGHSKINYTKVTFIYFNFSIVNHNKLSYTTTNNSSFDYMHLFKMGSIWNYKSQRTQQNVPISNTKL